MVYLTPEERALEAFECGIAGERLASAEVADRHHAEMLAKVRDLLPERGPRSPLVAQILEVLEGHGSAGLAIRKRGQE
jgi:hypothetical protein